MPFRQMIKPIAQNQRSAQNKVLIEVTCLAVFGNILKLYFYVGNMNSKIYLTGCLKKFFYHLTPTVYTFNVVPWI